MGVPCASFPSSSQGLSLYCSLDGHHSVTLESLQEAQGADQDQGGSQTERQGSDHLPPSSRKKGGEALCLPQGARGIHPPLLLEGVEGHVAGRCRGGMPGRAFPSLALGMPESRFLRDHPVVPNAEFRSQEAAMMSLGLETLDGRTSPTESPSGRSQSRRIRVCLVFLASNPTALWAWFLL